MAARNGRRWYVLKIVESRKRLSGLKRAVNRWLDDNGIIHQYGAALRRGKSEDELCLAVEPKDYSGRLIHRALAVRDDEGRVQVRDDHVMRGKLLPVLELMEDYREEIYG
jgi:hypothetical protein